MKIKCPKCGALFCVRMYKGKCPECGFRRLIREVCGTDNHLVILYWNGRVSVSYIGGGILQRSEYNLRLKNAFITNVSNIEQVVCTTPNDYDTYVYCLDKDGLLHSWYIWGTKKAATKSLPKYKFESIWPSMFSSTGVFLKRRLEHSPGQECLLCYYSYNHHRKPLVDADFYYFDANLDYLTATEKTILCIREGSLYRRDAEIKTAEDVFKACTNLKRYSPKATMIKVVQAQNHEALNSRNPEIITLPEYCFIDRKTGAALYWDWDTRHKHVCQHKKGNINIAMIPGCIVGLHSEDGVWIKSFCRDFSNYELKFYSSRPIYWPLFPKEDMKITEIFNVGEKYLFYLSKNNNLYVSIQLKGTTRRGTKKFKFINNTHKFPAKIDLRGVSQKAPMKSKIICEPVLCSAYNRLLYTNSLGQLFSAKEESFTIKTNERCIDFEKSNPVINLSLRSFCILPVSSDQKSWVGYGITRMNTLVCFKEVRDEIIITHELKNPAFSSVLGPYVYYWRGEACSAGVYTVNKAGGGNITYCNADFTNKQNLPIGYSYSVGRVRSIAAMGYGIMCWVDSKYKLNTIKCDLNESAYMANPPFFHNHKKYPDYYSKVKRCSDGTVYLFQKGLSKGIYKENFPDYKNICDVYALSASHYLDVERTRHWNVYLCIGGTVYLKKRSFRRRRCSKNIRVLLNDVRYIFTVFESIIYVTGNNDVYQTCINSKEGEILYNSAERPFRVNIDLKLDRFQQNLLKQTQKVSFADVIIETKF